MVGKIIINIERCKGCGLCISVCPKNGIIISKCSNKAGYFPAQPVNKSDSFDKLTTSCTGCAMCAIICPDVAIEVFCERAKPAEIRNRKRKPNLIREKA